ncbi:MAG: lactonase family protein [Acidobacteria bacterium]|nr:lactonase family protein [Acidobacteriota bacterium]
MNTESLSRRTFCHSLAAIAAGVALVEAAANEWLLYVGTYTNAETKSEGVYVYRFNAATGELKPSSLAKSPSPAFLAIDAKRRFLYAANEVGEFNGQKNGGVTAFSISQQTGELTQLNQQPAPGVPAHITVHPSGRFVLIADYGGGNAAIYPVKLDGSLGAMSDVAQHTGKGATQRQTEPHAHCVIVDAAGKHAFVPDLGLDKVMIYKIDTQLGKLVAHGFGAVKPGAGPRHFVFHPNNEFAYVINELNSTVTMFEYIAARGTLSEVQSISTLPVDFKGTSYCADIHIHPTGKFVYGSNRGHNSIVIYAIDAKTKKLTLVGHEPVRGDWPRNFGIDPTGQVLLVANQRSNNIVVFRIDVKTGLLKATEHTVALGAPVCLKFIPAFS